jgi:hypothetical protein
MVIRLVKKDGKPLFLNTRAFITAEETANGDWLVTIDVRVLAPIGGPNSGVRSTTATTSRVLDLDAAGAAPLLTHLDECVRTRNNP